MIFVMSPFVTYDCNLSKNSYIELSACCRFQVTNCAFNMQQRHLPLMRQVTERRCSLPVSLMYLAFLLKSIVGPQWLLINSLKPSSWTELEEAKYMHSRSSEVPCDTCLIATLGLDNRASS
ncbi:unnamed protein product [Ilex paraguariensis]|uniref:Uncharacterized protein n=1 Tax=Ilex paraguariensis TaxID=185542 RepID=A0ABC8SIX3_9AQUA